MLKINTNNVAHKRNSYPSIRREREREIKNLKLYIYRLKNRNKKINFNSFTFPFNKGYYNFIGIQSYLVLCDTVAYWLVFFLAAAFFAFYYSVNSITFFLCAYINNNILHFLGKFWLLFLNNKNCIKNEYVCFLYQKYKKKQLKIINNVIKFAFRQIMKWI